MIYYGTNAQKKDRYNVLSPLLQSSMLNIVHDATTDAPQCGSHVRPLDTSWLGDDAVMIGCWTPQTPTRWATLQSVSQEAVALVPIPPFVDPSTSAGTTLPVAPDLLDISAETLSAIHRGDSAAAMLG